MSAQAPLQAGVQTFADVQAQPNYQALSPDIQSQIADDFFERRVATQPQFKAAPPDAQEAMRQDFKAKYNVPSANTVLPATGNFQQIQRPSAPPQGNFLSDFMATAINSGSAGALDLPHGQGVGSTLGSIAGPFVGTLGAAALAPETGGASLLIPAAYMGLVGAGNTAREQYNRSGAVDNPLAVGVSGLTNAGFSFLGPVARAAGRPVRVAANAAFGGGQNALQDIIQQGAEQHSWTPNVDWNRVKNSALMGAGLGGGFAWKGKKAPSVEAPRAQEPLQASVSNLPDGVGASVSRRDTVKSGAQQLYDLLNSQDATERAQGMELQGRARRISTKPKARDLPETLRQLAASPEPGGYERYKAARADYQQLHREILAELSILKEQNRATGKAKTPARSKEEIDRAVKLGVRMRRPVETGMPGKKSDGTLKAQFDNYLKRRFNQEDQRIINARIGKAIGEAKTETATISGKVKERVKKRQAKQEARRKEAAKKAQEEKKAQIKAENERIKAELKKQADEESAGLQLLEGIRAGIKATEKPSTFKATDRQATGPDEYAKMARDARSTPGGRAPAKTAKATPNTPKVLTPDEIEIQAEKLFQSHQKGEKGTLEAQISKLRTAARTDYSKSGAVDKSRSDAINETHARVLDRFNQKKSEAQTTETAKKPENVVKARAENLKTLEENQKAGGSHDFNTGKGKQHPIKAEALKWDDVRDTITDPEVREWGDTIDAAMRTDGVVRVRYDAERVGDTGEFENKELSPIDWGFNFSRDEKGNVVDTRVVFHAVNKYGHTGEYYLQPSDANAQTGTVSMVLEAPTRLPGKKAFRNTDPNVYKGPREFKIGDVMGRPPRRNQGLTSEGQAKLIEAREILGRYEAGESVSAKEIKKANTAAKKVAKDAKAGKRQTKAEAAAESVGKSAKKNKSVREIIESENVTPDTLKGATEEVKDMPSTKDVDKAANC